jgi:hypothetical protein
MHQFHPLTDKQIGDRVKAPYHPASPDTKYFYGTVIHRPPHDDLEVEWDKPIPFMGKYSSLLPAIRI